MATDQSDDIALLDEVVVEDEPGGEPIDFESEVYTKEERDMLEEGMNPQEIMQEQHANIEVLEETESDLDVHNIPANDQNVVTSNISNEDNKAKEATREELKLFLGGDVYAGLKNPISKQMKKSLRVHCFIVKKKTGWKNQRTCCG